MTSMLHDVATYEAGVRSTSPQSRDGKVLRVCMLAYAFYESDTRILQYATALAERGESVDVIALKRSATQPACEVIGRVTVYRVQTRAVDETGTMTYLWRILGFLLRSMFLLRRLHRTASYDLIHVHNVPDFLVFAALPARWTGVPVILDIHDLLPELYASKFKIETGSLLFRVLALAERCSAAFATHVIIANDLWQRRLIARSCPEAKCSVVRNRPDLSIFKPRRRRDERVTGSFRMVYPGSLNVHQGLDIAIAAFARVVDRMPDTEFHIYGEGPAKALLIQQAKSLGLEHVVLFHDVLPSREIAEVMASADLAIEPKRSRSNFSNEALSTKILEFMSLGIPIIACRTRVHAFYYDRSIIQYYEDDDESELAEQMLRLRHDPEGRDRLARNAEEYMRENTWDRRKHEYLELVDSLVTVRRMHAEVRSKLL